jgi:hypothetical protein
MSTSGSVDVPLDMFGGLVTDVAPPDLPPGVSPDCQDVKFLPGGVSTRPGLVNQFTAINTNPTVNYLKTYIPQSGLLRLLLLDSTGVLWKESSVGILSQVAGGLVPSSYGKSTSLFTREYLAIGDSKYGIDLPRQFDDTNFDRVSQTGPGAPPSVADEVVSASIAGSPTGLIQQTRTISATGLSESGNLCMVVLTASLTTSELQAGDSITISGAGVGGYRQRLQRNVDSSFSGRRRHDV